MTKGEELKKALGLQDTKYVSFVRTLNTPRPFLVIVYDTRRPEVPLTNYRVMKQFRFFNVREYPYTKDVKYTPLLPIEDFNGASQPSMIFCVDIGGIYADPDKQISRDSSKVRESIDECYKPRLDEWITFSALNSPASISAFTKKHRDIRSGVMGGENKTAKLINCVYNPQQDCLTFIFRTGATPIYPADYTYKKTNPTLDFQLSNNPDKTYYTHFRILDFMKWLKGTRPDNLADQPITWREIKDVLEVAYVQVYCSCPSFQYQTANWDLSQVDGSIYPTDIAPKFWNQDKYHGDGQNFLCKHLYGIVRHIGFFGNQMASMASKELRDRGYINANQ